MKANDRLKLLNLGQLVCNDSVRKDIESQDKSKTYVAQIYVLQYCCLIFHRHTVTEKSFRPPLQKYKIVHNFLVVHSNLKFY